MRAAALLLLLSCAISLAAAGAPLRTEKLGIFGKEYYRLDEWARANGFQYRRGANKDVEVSNKLNRLQFTGDSRRMFLNGMLIVLSHDVVLKDNVAYVTPLDIQRSIAPILWPQRDAKPIRHVCIDPGHGGKDMGEHSGGEQEKRYTLLLAQELAQELRKSGFTVSLTRTADTFIDLDERTDVAERRGADIFVSLHFNSAGRSSDVRGAETYCLTPAQANSTNDRGAKGSTGAVTGNRNDSKNVLLAYHVQKSLVRTVGAEDRGVKRARFEVLRRAQMPAVLVESGFMSNPAEARQIYSAAWRRRVAQAITSGIVSYRGALNR